MGDKIECVRNSTEQDSEIYGRRNGHDKENDEVMCGGPKGHGTLKKKKSA